MKRKPTIVVAAHDVGGQGGMERHLQEKIMRLKKDANVIVVASSMKLPNAAGVRFIRIPVIARPVPLKMVLYAIFATIRLLFLKYDILHTTGAILFKRADFSTVHYCGAGYMKSRAAHMSNDRRSLLQRLNTGLATKIALRMERFIYQPKRTKKLVTVSTRVKYEVLHSFPYDDADVEVIPNGVDTQTFHPYSHLEKNNIRIKLGLPGQGRFLLFMGGDWYLKGLDLVIEAFNQLAGELPDLYLLIVGKGEKKGYEQLLSPNLRHRAYFTGKQPNPEEWFGASDMFVFPSSYESFSLVAHEAAAAGLTIISTKVGGVEELIEDSVSGFIVERDGQHIAQTIRQIFINDETHHYGINARMRVEKLTWQNTYDQFLTLYEKRLNSPTRNFTGSRGVEIERNHS